MKRDLAADLERMQNPPGATIRNDEEDWLTKFLDEPIPLWDAPRLFPKNRKGKHPHRSQVYRWGKTGKRGVVLATWLFGTCLVTNRRAVAEFTAALTATLGRPSAPKVDGHADAAAANQRLLNSVFSRGKGVSK
jgi:hypothetical protein